MGMTKRWVGDVFEERRKEAYIEARIKVPYTEEEWEALESEYYDRDDEYYEENESDFEDYLAEIQYSKHLESISSDHSKIFYKKIESIGKIMELSIDKETDKDLLIMLYGYTISALEGYIYATFFNTVINSDELLKKLVGIDKFLMKKTINLTDFFVKNQPADDVIKSIITKHLKDIVYHKIERIKPLYKGVLNADFGNVEWLYKAVTIRHDCAHRAGYNQDGEENEIKKEQLEILISNCEDFVYKIDADLARL